MFVSIPARSRRQPSTARKAIQNAIAREIENHATVDDAVRYFTERATVYYNSPEGAGEFFVYPAKFFDDERYNEPTEAWNGREKARNGL